MKDMPIYTETLEYHVDAASTEQEFNDLERMDRDTTPKEKV